tara:strand:+ start:233 stop:787 length:555 start_codon:yes stop_codon:yes gene_type:complete
MQVEQRIFQYSLVFLVFVQVLGLSTNRSVAAENRVIIADGKLSLALPGGWSESDLNADDVLAGYATQDNRSSVFFQSMLASTAGSMQDLLDRTIANFDERFRVTKVDEEKTGQVEGPDKKWPGIFTTAEVTVEKGEDEFDMKFYLLVFDTGTSLYFMQASTTRPIRESRERQIYELIRSIVAKS